MSNENESVDADLLAQVVAKVVAQMGGGNTNVSPSEDGEKCAACGKAAHRPGTKIYAKCQRKLAAEDEPEEGERVAKGAASRPVRAKKGKWQDVPGSAIRADPKVKPEYGTKLVVGRAVSPEGEMTLSVKRMVRREKDDQWWVKSAVNADKQAAKALYTAIGMALGEWDNTE